MKRLYLLSVLLIISFGNLFALDFGGNFDNTALLSYSENSGDYRESNFSLWLIANFNSNLNFKAQGSYTYSTVTPYMFELDILKLSSVSDSIFSYTAGRFWTADFSNYIFNHTLDGAKAEFVFPKASLAISAGYTGLLYKKSSSIIMSKADQSDMLNSEKIFASPRLIAGLDLLMPELFLYQDLNISFWMQADLRSESELLSEGIQLPSAKGGKVQSQYSGLGLKGTLLPSLYYDSSIYLGTGKTLSYIGAGYSYQNILSFLGSLGLRYYGQDRFYSKTGFSFIYSSGDSDYDDFTEGNTGGNSSNFIPISRTAFGLVFSPQLGNIFLTKLSYSMKPFGSSKNTKLQNIQTEFKAVGFFRSTAGQISEPGIDSSSDSLYLGTEVDTIINLRLFSDFGVALSGGLFLPDTTSGGAFLASERNVEYIAKAEFSFSF